MMAAAVVARRFVPQMHSPHIERGRGMMKKKRQKKDKRWGLRELNTATARHRSNLQTLKSTYEN